MNNYEKLHVNDPFESKYQLLINRKEKVGIKKLKNPKAFIGYSQTIDDVYENLEGYNPTKKRKVLIVFDYVTADIESNQKLIVLNSRKLNMSLVFTSQSYFKVPKTTRLNATHYFIMKICFYHVTYEFESESTLYSCLNVKELLARSRHHI